MVDVYPGKFFSSSLCYSITISKVHIFKETKATIHPILAIKHLKGIQVEVCWQIKLYIAGSDSQPRAAEQDEGLE